jgi:CheY-like chemotaxis protein
MAKIIMIDDDHAMLRMTRRVLESGGHAVDAYENGRAAIDHLEREAPDLLITDIFMPDVEGLETIRRARTLWPDLPIIAMSGASFEAGDYLEIAEQLGAFASLKKPFAPAELLDLVARLIQQSKPNP